MKHASPDAESTGRDEEGAHDCRSSSCILSARGGLAVEPNRGTSLVPGQVSADCVGGTVLAYSWVGSISLSNRAWSLPVGPQGSGNFRCRIGRRACSDHLDLYPSRLPRLDFRCE